MADINLSAVLHGKGDLRLEERPIPDPGPGEVQISVHSTGICGTDIHLYTDGRIGKHIVSTPYVLGHESCGTVSKLGQGVTHLQVGDRVTVEPGASCGQCGLCINGRYNLCTKQKFLGDPTVDGFLARYVVQRAALCFKMPDNMTFEEGAMIEPLSVAMQAYRRSGSSVGKTVLVCGAGPIGLMCMLVAKASGAAAIAITDILQSRLALANTMGADHAVRVTSQNPREVAQEVIAALGTPADVTFDCAGSDASVQAGLYATKPGGVLTLVGLGNPMRSIPIEEAIFKEIDIKTACKYVDTYPTALSLVASGQMNIKPLVTHHFPLASCLEAFNTVMSKDKGAMKVIVDCFKP